MLQKVLNAKVDGVVVKQDSGESFSVTLPRKNLIFLKIGGALYLLIAVFFTAVLIAAYCKGAKVYEGKEMPFWFLAVFFFAEWLPLFCIGWFVFAERIFHFDDNSFELRIKHLFLVRNKLSIDKKHIHKILLIRQSDDSSVCTLKVQTENSEGTVLWMRPYEQCHWLGTVVATWSGKPLEK